MASPTQVIITILSDEEEALLLQQHQQRRQQQQPQQQPQQQQQQPQQRPVVVEDRNEERRNDGGSDDDDCFILDRDPDEPIRIQNNGPDDELLIVAEKGEVACRDFPHARHLCVNFPFDNTSHEKFCSLCHCYVCDSPAPCVHWGNGVLRTDHCHATDKVGMWKILRNSFKTANVTAAPGGQQAKIKLIIGKPMRNSAPVFIPGVTPLVTPTPFTLETLCERHARSEQSAPGRGATALTQPSFMQSLSPKRKPSPPRYRISYGHKFFRRASAQPTKASDETHGTGNFR